MKITDLKCAVIGNNPVVRINTDEGIYGLGEVEASKSYLKPLVLFYKDDENVHARGHPRR